MVDEQRDERLIQAVLSSGVRIPPMPGVLAGLNALLADPDAGPAELAHLVARDGAISGALFRLVASPVFGLRAKVETVEKAIVMLGMRNAAAVVRSESLRKAFQVPDQARALEAIWNRGTAVADLSVLALKTGHIKRIPHDAAYTLGTFHDCGLALLCKREPAYARALSEPGPWPDIPALDRAHQTDHTLIGQMVARNWLLPEDVTQAIRVHHVLSWEDLDEPTQRLCALLNFACHLHNRQSGAADDEWENGWQAETARRLFLTAADLEDWENEVAALAV